MNMIDPYCTPWGANVPPEHVNELGVKFWRDRSMQDYAIRKGVQVQCLYAELPDGTRTRLLSKDGEVIYESQQLEAVAVHIDILAVINSTSK